MDQPSSSQLFKDLADNSGAVLVQFYSLAKSTCWVRPMILVDGIWMPLQGNDYWRSSFRLSIFVNRKRLPERIIDENFVPHGCFIEPVQYWGTAPSLIHSWGWYRVCTEVIRYSMFGCLRPVRDENLCRATVAIDSVVDVLERLPTNFCSVVEQGQAKDNFFCYFSDSDIQSELESTPEIDLVSSDGSTVYRSPSPQFDSFQEVDSSEPNVQLASGPTISVFTQEEQSYFVQSPESPPPSFQQRDSSTSFTDSPMHFNIDDIPLDDTAENQFSLPAISSVFSASLDDLRTFLSQRIDDSQNDILSKLNTLDRGHRDTMRQHQETLRNLIDNARQDNQTQGDVHILHLNEFKKGVLAHGASVTADLMEVRKEVKALDAKVTYLDGQVAAIRSELFDFQAKVAENYLNLSTQLGDLIDYIRGGDAKKGEGSSSRPQPPPDDQGSGSGGGGSGGRTTDIVDRFSGSMS
ncbi:structural maintenance of chromosomes protein 3 [Dorcoceras hygrometricum]|uniref:Structural maintenance of chromosomes protein 3 n=1 Tax=Dorcoceras hygrometricum TaxID=472368 RepID=A0A2Z7BE78_9LAMI|nr:structural maintenance of chromosomes protein 3 [Dorcoceras hygrometricum]